MSMKVFFGADPELERVATELGKITPAVKKAIRQEMGYVAVDIQNDILRSMRETPRAHWSYKRGTMPDHHPSKPWEPPAVDGGRLINSIIIEKASDQVEVGASNCEYAVYLEEGTVHMAPRRFISPVMEHFSPLFAGRIFGAAARAVAKTGRIT